MANFPSSLDTSSSLPNPTGTSTQASPDHAQLHVSENQAIIAVETKIGTGSSTPTTGKLLTGTGTGTSSWTTSIPSGTIVGTTDSQTLTSKTLTSPVINTPTITNATISADTITGFTTSNSGTIYGISITTGSISSALSLGSTLSVTGNTTLSGTLTAGQPSFQTSTAATAGGVSAAGIKLSSTANFGLFFGSGAPTFSAAQGSIYLRTDGSSTSTRLYANTTGSTTWTNFTSAA